MPKTKTVIKKISEVYKISDGKYSILVEVNGNTATLRGHNWFKISEGFKFVNSDKETITKIGKLIQKAGELVGGFYKN